MKAMWITMLSLGLLVAAAVLGAHQNLQALKTETEVRSYALGMEIGSNLRKMGIQVDPAVLARGLSDALAGGPTLMTQDEARQAIARVQLDFKSRQILPSTGPEQKPSGGQK